MQRGWLAFESATSAAASGDLHRAVMQLKRMLAYITTDEDRCWSARRTNSSSS
jgi:hypothetical protein